jgi:hypothetical protein
MHATASKSLIFVTFAPSAAGIHWLTNARGWLIPIAILLVVRFSPIFSNVGDMLTLI